MSTYHVHRFFEVQQRAAQRPVPVRLRATFSHRPAPNVDVTIFDLKLFVDGVLAFKSSIWVSGTTPHPPTQLDTMMGELLWEILLQGFTLGAAETKSQAQASQHQPAVVPATSALVDELLPVPTLHLVPPAQV